MRSPTTLRAKALLAIALAVVGMLAAWRLWPIATSTPSPTPPNGAQEDLARDAAAFLAKRAASITPIESASAFESPAALDAVAPDLAQAGLTPADARAALAHAASMMYLRYARQDFDAYTAWRRENGYAFFPAERLRKDPVYRNAIERGAGLALRDDEHDTSDLWRLYWTNAIEPGPRFTGVDQSPDGTILLAWKSTESLSLPKAAPARRAPRSPIMSIEPNTPGSRVGLWRGATIALGWPVWFPPPDVEAHLLKPGTPFIEVGWVLRTETGGVQPFILILAMDTRTRRWWILQFAVPHAENRVRINAGGI